MPDTLPYRKFVLIRAEERKACFFFLGCVDEFDQAEASGETDDSSKISFRLFAAGRNPFEAFEASEALLDA